MIEDRSVDVVIAVGTNMFYTVTLPVTLWFLDRSKKNATRADQVLFIDARETYNKIDRAHRDWTPAQIEFLSNIVRLWRQEAPEFETQSEELLKAVMPEVRYIDVAGLCGTATISQIEDSGWSLNPGRYVGHHQQQPDHDFVTRLNELRAEFVSLNERDTVLSATVTAVLSEYASD